MTEPQHSTGAPEGAHGQRTPLYGPRFLRDPAALYREMRREHGPVAPVLIEGDVPAWFVMGYREVHHVLSNPQVFARDSRRWNAWDRIPDDWPLMPFVGYQPSVLFAEGAEHQRRAGAISDALSDLDQFDLGARCEKLADELIDGFAGRGEADLMTAFAHPMPLLAVAYMFGLPDNEAPDLLGEMITTMNGGEGANEAFHSIQARVTRLLERKREVPGQDVTSRLLSHSASLTEEELINDLIVVMTTAQQPLAYWIGNTIRLMLTDDRFAMSLSGARRSVGQALHEVLWEDTPTQNVLGRWATRNTELGGQRIREGDLLVIGLAAANSDPEVRPATYDDSAGNQAMMSFSHGEHRCTWPAPEIAAVIATRAVEVLLDRLPDMDLAVSPDALVWSPSVWMRGLAALPVRFTPVHAHG